MIGCSECDAHVAAAGHALIGACASVGIERGLSTQQMFSVYIASVHQKHAN